MTCSKTGCDRHVCDPRPAFDGGPVCQTCWCAGNKSHVWHLDGCVECHPENEGCEDRWRCTEYHHNRQHQKGIRRLPAGTS